MKKLLVVMLSLVMCVFALAGCGGSSDTSSDDASKSDATEVAKTDKSVDAVAEALGLTGGEETMYEYIGATAGKQFNDGAVEIYQYDTSSDSYKEIEDSGEISGIKVSSYKDGMVLIFANDEENADIKAAFDALVF